MLSDCRCITTRRYGTASWQGSRWHWQSVSFRCAGPAGAVLTAALIKSSPTPDMVGWSLTCFFADHCGKMQGLSGIEPCLFAVVCLYCVYVCVVFYSCFPLLLLLFLLCVHFVQFLFFRYFFLSVCLPKSSWSLWNYPSSAPRCYYSNGQSNTLSLLSATALTLAFN